MTLSAKFFDIGLVINLLLGKFAAPTLPHLVVDALGALRTVLLRGYHIVLVHELLVLLDDLLDLVYVTVVFLQLEVDLPRRLEPVLQLLLRFLIATYIIYQ